MSAIQFESIKKKLYIPSSDAEAAAVRDYDFQVIQLVSG